MGRSWNDIRKDKEARDHSRGRDMEAARANARTLTQAYILGDRLAQLRTQEGLTQAEIADRMQVSQARVSKLERGDLDQLEVGTIRRYVASLGSNLKLVADFEDHDVTVSTSEVDRTDALV